MNGKMKGSSQASADKVHGTGLSSAPVECVVAGRLCCGCGVCAGVCPMGALRMRLNPDGEFIPELVGDCRGCKLCVRVCPVLSVEIPERCRGQESRQKELGLLAARERILIWGGYALDPKRRLASASGGMLTLVLCHLLQTDQIDAAIVVGRAHAHSRLLFEAKVARSRGAIEAACGSKYYPVEYSEPIRELLSTGERVAVVGLPCHCRAVRQAMASKGPLREQVRFVLGLTCGHGVSTAFTDLLLAAAGATPAAGASVAYREKLQDRPASDYAFAVSRDGKTIGRRVTFTGGVYGAAWLRRLFVPRACDLCSDCFAEQADATFMDAWLPEHVGDPRGTSLVVTRTTQTADVLRDLADAAAAEVWRVSPSDAVRSQRGVVRYKRDLLPARIHLALSKGQPVPAHLAHLGVKGTAAERREVAQYERNRRVARSIWRLPLPAGLRLRLVFLLATAVRRHPKKTLLTRLLHSVKVMLRSLLGKRGTALAKKIVGGRPGSGAKV